MKSLEKYEKTFGIEMTTDMIIREKISRNLYWTLGDCKKATRLKKEGPAYALKYIPNHRNIGNLDLSIKQEVL